MSNVPRTARVTVDIGDIRSVISAVMALDCATPTCPGAEEPHNPGVTCLRCGALQTMNSWLPEGEREDWISEEEEGVNSGGDLCDTCGASGVQIDHTDDDGNTVCTECAEEAESK